MTSHSVQSTDKVPRMCVWCIQPRSWHHVLVMWCKMRCKIGGCRNIKSRNPVFALLSLSTIVMLACAWYLGQEVLTEKVVTKDFQLQLKLQKGLTVAQSIVPVEGQRYKMPSRSKHPGTSTVPLLAAVPLFAQSAKLCDARCQDPESPPRVLCPVSPSGILPSCVFMCVRMFFVYTCHKYPRTCHSSP